MLARTPVSCRRLCGPTNAWHHLLFIWVISKFIGEVQQMAYNPSLYVKQRSNFVDLFASVLACCASVFRYALEIKVTGVNFGVVAASAIDFLSKITGFEGLQPNGWYYIQDERPFDVEGPSAAAELPSVIAWREMRK